MRWRFFNTLSTTLSRKYCAILRQKCIGEKKVNEFEKMSQWRGSFFPTTTLRGCVHSTYAKFRPFLTHPSPLYAFHTLRLDPSLLYVRIWLTHPSFATKKHICDIARQCWMNVPIFSNECCFKWICEKKWNCKNPFLIIGWSGGCWPWGPSRPGPRCGTDGVGR